MHSTDSSCLEGFQILLVDDERELAELIAWEMEGQKAVVHLAGSGEEALKLLAKHPIDVVVSDLRMPHGDGIFLLKTIKERDLYKPQVMLMTGFADISLEEAYDLGAAAVFQKPFTIDSLIEKIVFATQPPDQRWAKPVEKLPKHKLSLSFPSIKSAVEQHLFSLGLGGIFLAKPEVPADTDELSFELTFTQDKHRLEGVGHIRWRRHSPGALPLLGIGLEIQYIHDEAERLFWLKFLQQHPRCAYIPKE